MRFSVVASVAALLSFACSPGGGTPTETCATTTDCSGERVCIDGVCVEGTARDAGGDSTTDRPDAPTIRIAEIRIEPATVTLRADGTSRPEQDFEVVGVRADGTETAIAVGIRWSIDTRTTGELDVGSGTFTANGVIGGTATISAAIDGESGELSASATVEVQIVRELVGPDVPADPGTLFAAPVDDGAASAGLVYPLDGAVMPQNVYPADVQWTRGVEGDVFRVRLAKPHAEITAYLRHAGAGFGNHWLVDPSAWRTVAQTDPDEPATVVVDRHEVASGRAIAGVARSIRFARAALTGSVYYWDIQAGRIVRIDDGTATPNEFMPSPPIAMRGEGPCVGCHSVSRSGRYMAGRLGGGENVGAVFDLTTDLTSSPPPSVFPVQTVEPTSARWWFSSWSPDDTRLVLSSFEAAPWGGQMRFMDPFTGAIVPMAGVAPTNVTHPAWSPDGTQIAYVTNVNGWGGVFTDGDIATVDVAGDALGASRVIHVGDTLAGSSPAGTSDSYPTWSPDSTRIAFSHGSGTRSEDQQAALYAMARDGSGVVRLDAANGGDTTNFQPNFSPFDQGGFFWVSFLSRRDYGNAEVGTAGRGLQQIWVTAIQKDAPPGTDPSRVAYWLPGQRTSSRNISAFWAPRPCRTDGEGCSVGSECCGGDCRPDESGALVCAPPPPDRCRNDGETCSTTADCCEGLECFGRVCLSPLD